MRSNTRLEKFQKGTQVCIYGFIKRVSSWLGKGFPFGIPRITGTEQLAISGRTMFYANE